MLKKPKVPHDILTTLCAIATVVAQDPKKVKFIQKHLGKEYNIKTTLVFAGKHNKSTDQ